MIAESGALIKTGANEQVFLASRRSEQALIEREYRGLAKDYARDLMRLADSMLAEEITSETEAEQVAVIDQLLVYKSGRMEKLAARFPSALAWMLAGEFIGIFASFPVFGNSMWTVAMLISSVLAMFVTAVIYDTWFVDNKAIGWLIVRRKLRLLKGDDFSPHDALHQ